MRVGRLVGSNACLCGVVRHVGYLFPYISTSEGLSARLSGQHLCCT
jgi:hypothetical protein